MAAPFPVQPIPVSSGVRIQLVHPASLALRPPLPLAVQIASFKITPREVISGIAPHVFDEHAKRPLRRRSSRSSTKSARHHRQGQHNRRSPTAGSQVPHHHQRQPQSSPLRRPGISVEDLIVFVGSGTGIGTFIRTDREVFTVPISAAPEQDSVESTARAKQHETSQPESKESALTPGTEHSLISLKETKGGKFLSLRLRYVYLIFGCACPC
jgi:hypothetical protein